MGEMFLELTVANIEDLEKQTEVSFLVDTGATRSWLPQNIADELGIKPIGHTTLTLADDSDKEMPYSACWFDFGGERIVGNIIIGPPHSEPLAGVHLLQDFRLVIDLERHTISRKRAMRAK